MRNFKLLVKAITTSLLMIFAFISTASADYTWENVPTGYGLAWSDEFNGTVGSLPNAAYWNYDTGVNQPNNELENYTNSANNVHVIADPNAVDGKSLVIIALDPGGNNDAMGDYTSARITTQNQQTFTYGYMEARVKMPYGQGIWPAFWMLGNNINNVGWPACDEIDIMENIGNAGDQGTNHMSLHDGNDTTFYPALPGGQLYHNAYHTFSALWKPNQIQFFVDGSLMVTDTPATMGNNWGFNNNPNFFLLNVATGGNWPGNPDGSTSFPQTMYVDYVRAYQTGYATPTPVVQSTWRIHSGGDSYTDSQGNLWVADTNFTGGWPSESGTAVTGTVLPATTDQSLYQWQRYGNATGGETVTYTLNVPTTSMYQVTLKFAETYFTAAGQRQFNYSINGTTEATNFDIFAAAGGRNRALDEVYNNITPNANGQIVIQFTQGAYDNPTVGGIQVVPIVSTPTATPTPVVASTWRVNTGGPAYTDSQGHVWAADENYTGGTAAVTTSTIAGSLPASTDQTLYQSQRYGNPFSYSFNVPAGSYQVTLKFAETYWTAAGQRVFNVSVNGTTVLTNFDIFATAGGQNKAVDEVLNNIAPSGGVITITFGPASADNAMVDAIQIIPMPATATPTSTFSKTATNTLTATISNTPTLTITPTISSTFTNTPTNTPAVPTATMTNSFTSTPVNTSTATVTNTVSNTTTASYTATSTISLTPTNTPSGTQTPVNTNTPVDTATLTSTVTNTPAVPTSTPVNTNTPVNTPTGTFTSSPTASYTPSYTATLPPTATNTLTFTTTATNTPTNTPAVPTATKTNSFTPSATATNSFTTTTTATPSSTRTSTGTPTYTHTAVPPTATATALPRPVVYPNPATSSTITIQLPVSNAANVTVQIFTLAMRSVQTINVPQVMGNTLTVSLTDKNGVSLANGLYYFQIQVNGRKWLSKVLVLR